MIDRAISFGGGEDGRTGPRIDADDFTAAIRFYDLNPKGIAGAIGIKLHALEVRRLGEHASDEIVGIAGFGQKAEGLNGQLQRMRGIERLPLQALGFLVVGERDGLFLLERGLAGGGHDLQEFIIWPVVAGLKKLRRVRKDHGRSHRDQRERQQDFD